MLQDKCKEIHLEQALKGNAQAQLWMTRMPSEVDMSK